MDWKELANKANLVEYVEQYASLTKKGREYWCCSPLNEGDVNPSFSINEDKQIWYCYSTGKGGNILEFIKEFHHVSFQEAVSILAEYTGVSMDEPVSKRLSAVSQMKRFRTSPSRLDDRKGVILPNDYMNGEDFEHRPITEWENEFISPEIAESFNVRYSPRSDALMFPVFNKKHQLINVKGRKLHYEQRSGGKYFHLFGLPPVIDYFWGWHRALAFANQMHFLIIVEAEKSVMQADGYGYKNIVAIATSHITDAQLSTLLESKLPLVIALDKDKMPTLQSDKRFILLSKLTDVYCLQDENNLLNEKDSPTDRGKAIFEKLLKDRRRFVACTS